MAMNDPYDTGLLDLPLWLSDVLKLELYHICTDRAVRKKKNLQSSVNNFNKFKRIFTIFGTYYPDDTFY